MMLYLIKPYSRLSLSRFICFPPATFPYVQYEVRREENSLKASQNAV